MGARRSLVLALVCVCASTVHALHRESPGAVRLTTGSPHQASPGRAWGNWVAFASTEDLAGLGGARAPGSQIFLYNQDYYDCAKGLTFSTTPCPPAGTPFLRQVTNGPGDPDHPSVSDSPSTSTTQFDVWVAFDALGVFGGNVGPAATRRQIFLLHVSTSEVRQATAAGDGDNVTPSVSSLGDVVVFESTAMLAGFPNPAGVPRVFLYERSVALTRQVSIGPPPGNVLPAGASANGMPNETGTGVAFESTADLLGSGADTGVSQIFWADYDKGTHTVTLRQLTAGNAPSHDPFVGETPKVVAFDSEATDLPGTTGLPGRQIYQIPITTPPATTVTQMTRSDLFGDCSAPAIDTSATHLAFVCTGDPLENGTAGVRLFVFDESTTTLYQVTGEGTVTGRLAANVGQWFVTVATTSDLVNAGSCVQQLYVVDYFPGHWNAATLLGQFPPDVSDTNACGGSCTTNADCDDGNPCNGVETCGALHLCVRGAPVVCSDGNVCNGVETCNPATGTCVAGTPIPPCNDGNPCTDDACNPVLGCVAVPNTAPCDDGDPCTQGDVCAGGVCAGTELACPTCERCDPASATCVAGARAGCGAAGGLRSVLRLHQAPIAAGNVFTWKWRGASDAFGDPFGGDDYALCVFDGANGLAFRSDALASCGAGSCWQARPGGFLYQDRSGTPTGLTRLLTKTPPGGITRIAAKGKGANLALPSPASLTLPLRAQLQTSGGACWDAAYSLPDIRRDATSLKAKIR
jgi:hypothetical protein